MNSYSEITSRYLKQHKKRTLLIVIGIIVSISLFSGISTLYLNQRASDIESTKQMQGNYEVKYKKLDENKLDKIMQHTEVLNYGVEQSLDEGKLINENRKIEKPISINAYNKSSYDNIFKNYFDIKQGRLPLKENELVIENRALKELGDKKLGDKVTVEILNKSKDNKVGKKEYEIVGTYEDKVFSTSRYTGITFIKDEALKNKGLYDIYVNLKEKKDKINTAESLGKELGLNIIKKDEDKCQIEINEQLLREEGLIDSRISENTTAVMVAILFIIIILCSAAVIYNFFNMSVSERIKHFGILRSIGATPAQIRIIVFKEAFYMSLMALPAGLIMGYVGLIGILAIVKKVNNVNHDMLKIKFYPEVILVCTVLTLITILISVWIPARKAGKINLIDAIRNGGEYKREKIKRRRSAVFKFFFKLEGELAYKNIRRIPKRFWITVSSLIISIVLMIVYGTSISAIKQVNDKDHDLSNKDACFYKINNHFTEAEINEIKNLNGIDRVYKRAYNSCDFAFPKEYLNKNYSKETGRSVNMLEGTNFVNVGNTEMSFYGDNEFEVAKKYLISGKIDKKALSDMGVLLVNKNKVIAYKTKMDKTVTADFSTYKVGDKIVVPKIKSYPYHFREEDNKKEANDSIKEMKKAINNKEFYTFTVVGILDSDFLGENPQDGLGLVFTEDVYKKINGNLNSGQLLIKFKDKESRERLYDYFNKKASQIGGSYSDFYKQAEEERKTYLQQDIFVYTFIGLIILISAINIISTISINIMLRKREFAAMQAIGMEEEQLRKMVLLEGAIHGLIAAFVGSIIGGAIAKLLLYKVVPDDVKIKIPFEIFIIGIGGALIITLLASVIPIRRLKKMNIIESLRWDD